MGKFTVNDEQDKKQYYANKICPVHMCQNPGTAKDNTRGDGQWYCRQHVLDPNARPERLPEEEDWRAKLIAEERASHPERERQSGESRADFARRSIAFMREKMGMIGRGTGHD